MYNIIISFNQVTIKYFNSLLQINHVEMYLVADILFFFGLKSINIDKIPSFMIIPTLCFLLFMWRD